MFETDRGTFDRAFERVSRAYRLKVKPTEGVEICQTYFRALEPWPLDDVLFAIKTCIATCRRFPLVADIVEHLSPRPRSTAARDLRHMTVLELDMHADAAAKRYQDDPCSCDACLAAGVSDRPLRFVPVPFADDTVEQAFNGRRNEPEVVGHWAHGAELARWYAGHDAFFAPRMGNSTQARLRRLVRRAVQVAGAHEREPGEEG